ncbi:ParA family protein [Thalassospira xiamenensis]|uniref:Chromosome partitioning protein n=1 Tax=Thalassospira xiamenensis TaxID=220697 RepID=A0A285TXH5_9PROT|nr:ParA family protein [Thalassospira xiamenensis]SOC30452.1 chromosome partitioning protein [Thalassospira xiamenensis]
MALQKAVVPSPEIPPAEVGKTSASRKRKIVTVASPKGGSGKTTATRNLAVLAALEGLTVATVDFDRQRTLTKWWGKRPPECAPIIHYEVTLTDLEEVAAVAEIDDADIILVDTPPSVEDHAEAMRMLIDMSDLVLVATFQGGDDLDSVIPWMQYLRQTDIPAAFVLGGTKRRTISLEDAKRKLIQKGELCPIDLPHYEDISQAANVGLGIAEIKNAKGAEDAEGIWHFVRGRLAI